MTQSPNDSYGGPSAASNHAGGGGLRLPGSGLAQRFLAQLDRERSRWFGWVPVLIGLGAAFYFQLPDEPFAWAIGLVLVVGMVALRLSDGDGLAGILTLSLVLVLVGFSAAKIRSEWVRAPVLERSLSAAEVRGFVERVEPHAKRGARLTIRPFSIPDLKAEALPFRVRVRVLKTIDGLAPGDAITLRAKLTPPPPPALPGGFDFARHAWFQKIGAVGYTFQAPERINTNVAVPPSLRFAATIEQLRQTIAARIRRHLSGQTAAIAIALVTGERSGITEATNDVYRDAGLYHILSISGMHMAIMAGAVFFIVRLGLACIPPLVLRFNVKKWAAIAAALAALGYLALSGGAFATVRSYIMISVMFFAVLLDRPALALRNVAVAAVLILLIYPESILDPGFQMSFAAVAALVSVYEYLRSTGLAERVGSYGLLRRGMIFFVGIVLSTVVAGIAVAPFAAYHFHTTQHLAVVANLIAMPVSNIIIMPGALAVLILLPLGLEWPAAKLMGVGIDIMTATARWVAELPGAVGHIATMPAAAFALIIGGGLWLLIWQTRWRIAGLAAIATGLVLVPLGPRPDLLIGNKGKDVVVRQVTGQLVPIKQTRRLSFAMQRWLEADGQDVSGGRGVTVAGQKRRDPSQPVARCDAVGCVARVKGLTVAVAHHAGALRDDCRQADIVVFNAPRPKGCDAPRAVIDFFDVYYGGTHAVFLDDPARPRVVSVADVRGVRPWTATLPGRQRQQAQRAARANNRAVSPSRQRREVLGGSDVTQPPPSFDDADGDVDDANNVDDTR